ncbi:hypothetical protein [Streptomyces sp. NPDC059076]|uniref:hypothetical protein n=1 Tax=unclassified Streptomyces TaxID=2593676 RepID=UPI0036BE56EF
METVGGKAQLGREDWVALTQPAGRLRDSLGGGDVALALGPRVMAATWPGQRVRTHGAELTEGLARVTSMMVLLGSE